MRKNASAHPLSHSVEVCSWMGLQSYVMADDSSSKSGPTSFFTVHRRVTLALNCMLDSLIRYSSYAPWKVATPFRTVTQT